MKIEIIFPVLNEEKRLNNGIEKTIQYLECNNVQDYSIIIADNGSSDKTEEYSRKLVDKYNNVKYIKLKEKGVGLALQEGIRVSEGDIVGYMDIDLSTDINHLGEVLQIFENEENIDMVIGSRNSKSSLVEGRSFLRNITSYGLTYLINLLLGTTHSDYMCGFKFFRTSIGKELLKKCSSYKGWFYCAELIIVSEWIGYRIKEIEVHWKDDSDNSKVNGKMLKIINEYLKQIWKLKKKRGEFQ